MKMYSRAPLFEEPFAQTLSGKKKQTGDFATTKPKKITIPKHFPPRAFERRVLLKVEVCYTSSYVHIFTSSHLIIFTNSCMKKYSIFKHQAGDRWLSSRSVRK
jgi:hypothetical protein